MWRLREAVSFLNRIRTNRIMCACFLVVKKTKKGYGGTGGAGFPVLSVVEGFHVSPSIAPIKPRRKPMKKPPKVPNQLIIENTSTRIAPVLTLDLSVLFIMIAPYSVIIPHMSPITPTAKKPKPKSPKPARLKVVPAIAPIASMAKPPRRMKIAPIRDNANAAVGFSAIFSPCEPI